MGAITFEGHAIVSSDGMIADSDGAMPDALRNDADWQSFQQALDRAALVVLGRLGHSRHPNPGRRRLVLTRSVADLSPDPVDHRAVFWNPEGIEITEVLARLGITAGTVAITGGTGTFDHFLPLYDRFVLVEVADLQLPGGVPCFSEGPPGVTLSGHGLTRRSEKEIDPGIRQSVWTKAGG